MAKEQFCLTISFSAVFYYIHWPQLFVSTILIATASLQSTTNNSSAWSSAWKPKVINLSISPKRKNNKVQNLNACWIYKNLNFTWASTPVQILNKATQKYLSQDILLSSCVKMYNDLIRSTDSFLWFISITNSYQYFNKSHVFYYFVDVQRISYDFWIFPLGSVITKSFIQANKWCLNRRRFQGAVVECICVDIYILPEI